MHTQSVEMTHDFEANFNEFAPFSKEAAKELQDHAAKTPDIFVTQSRTQRWLRSKAPSFRALTILRAATIKEFARLELAPSCCYAIA